MCQYRILYIYQLHKRETAHKSISFFFFFFCCEKLQHSKVRYHHLCQLPHTANSNSQVRIFCKTLITEPDKRWHRTHIPQCELSYLNNKAVLVRHHPRLS